MDIIKHLGSKLAELINISAPAGRGLIKLAIKDELGPFRPLNQVTFNEFKNTIENSLKKRLIKLEISHKSHPFYTGKMKLVDTAGRIDKFKNRYAKHAKK